MIKSFCNDFIASKHPVGRGWVGMAISRWSRKQEWEKETADGER